jgi:hypothetical protein
MIQPTVGRIVDFFPHNDEGLPPGTKHAAIVCDVIDSRTINLAVFSSTGAPYSVLAAKLLQDADEAPWNGHYAAWMPYQKGQAAKTEALQAAPAPDLQPVHDRLSAIEQGVDGKFQAVGDWLTRTFKDFEDRLTALSTPPIVPEAPGGEPVADAAGELKVNADGAGGAPQAAS